MGHYGYFWLCGQNPYSGRGNNDPLAIMTHLAVVSTNNDPLNAVDSGIIALRARDYLHINVRNRLRIRELAGRMTRMPVPPLGSATRSAGALARHATYTMRPAPYNS